MRGAPYARCFCTMSFARRQPARDRCRAIRTTGHAGRRSRRQCVRARPDRRHRAPGAAADHRQFDAVGQGDRSVRPGHARRCRQSDPGRLFGQHWRHAQRTPDLCARVQPVRSAAVDRRHPGLSARGQPARFRTVPDKRHCRGPGRQRLCLGARRPRRHGRRDQPGHAQAHQGARGRARRHARSGPQGRIRRL